MKELVHILKNTRQHLMTGVSHMIPFVVAGGVLGGISTGQDLEVRIGIKPTSSIITPRESIDVHGQSTEVITKGRHDPCVGIRAAPIAEALLALVVMDHALRHRAQNADVDSGLAPIPASAS